MSHLSIALEIPTLVFIPQAMDKEENIVIAMQEYALLNEDDKQKSKKSCLSAPQSRQDHHFLLKLIHLSNMHGSRKLSMTKINKWIFQVDKGNLIRLNSLELFGNKQCNIKSRNNE